MRCVRRGGLVTRFKRQAGLVQEGQRGVVGHALLRVAARDGLADLPSISATRSPKVRPSDQPVTGLRPRVLRASVSFLPFLIRSSLFPRRAGLPRVSPRSPVVMRD